MFPPPPSPLPVYRLLCFALLAQFSSNVFKPHNELALNSARSDLSTKTLDLAVLVDFLKQRFHEDIITSRKGKGFTSAASVSSYIYPSCSIFSLSFELNGYLLLGLKVRVDIESVPSGDNSLWP